MQLSEMRALLDALDDLGDHLRSEQTAFLKDPSSDEPNAVLLGLASRLYRLLYAFLERPRRGRQTQPDSTFGRSSMLGSWSDG
jgi:hypothetical protein